MLTRPPSPFVPLFTWAYHILSCPCPGWRLLAFLEDLPSEASGSYAIWARCYSLLWTFLGIMTSLHPWAKPSSSLFFQGPRLTFFFLWARLSFFIFKDQAFFLFSFPWAGSFLLLRAQLLSTFWTSIERKVQLAIQSSVWVGFPMALSSFFFNLNPTTFFHVLIDPNLKSSKCKPT